MSNGRICVMAIHTAQPHYASESEARICCIDCWMPATMSGTIVLIASCATPRPFSVSSISATTSFTNLIDR